MENQITETEVSSVQSNKLLLWYQAYRKPLLGIACVLLIGICYFSFILFRSNTSIQKISYITIRPGSSYSDVLKECRGVLFNIDRFEKVASWFDLEKRFKPGRYKIEPGMNSFQIVRMIRGGLQEPVKFRVKEERYLSKEVLVREMDLALEVSADSLLWYLNDPEYCQTLGFTPETVIGIFAPNTYEFYWTQSVHTILQKFIDQYNRFWTTERKQKAEKLKLTLPEVITLASIVQAETAKDAEKPRIAGVYLNRLQIGMPLQADPTIIFGIGDFSIRRVTRVHTRSDSPYNTYLKRGLPVGPINSPSVSSIDAVLNAESHKYIYFCAKSDFSGFHEFAEDYEIHKKYARAYQDSLEVLLARKNSSK